MPDLITVDDRTHTDLMEQLQESYVGSGGLHGGRCVQPVGRDYFKYDVEFMRQLDTSVEEVSVRAHSKSTTSAQVHPRRHTVQLQFETREATKDW